MGNLPIDIDTLSMASMIRMRCIPDAALVGAFYTANAQRWSIRSGDVLYYAFAVRGVEKEEIFYRVPFARYSFYDLLENFQIKNQGNWSNNRRAKCTGCKKIRVFFFLFWLLIDSPKWTLGPQYFFYIKYNIFDTYGLSEAHHPSAPPKSLGTENSLLPRYGWAESWLMEGYTDNFVGIRKGEHPRNANSSQWRRNWRGYF